MIVRIKRGVGLKNWRVYLYSENGQILNISEGYFSQWNAKRAARKVYPNFRKLDVRGQQFN